MSNLREALPLIAAAAAGPVPYDRGGLEPFAAMVAALIARQVGPESCTSIIGAMGDQGLLDPAHLDRAGLPEIQDALHGQARPVSVRTLAPVKHLARWLVDRHGGRVEAFLASARSTDDLREELAAVKGIGMAAADAILLAALKRPAYPVDRGTYRILARHDWLDPSATYEEARDLLVHAAGDEPDLLLRLSGGMEELARRYCRASAPRCDHCPLKSLLPEGGPRGAGDD